MKRICLLLTLIITFGIGFSACDNSDTGHVTVKLTDAPLDTVDEVNVVITRVDVVMKGSGSLNAGKTEEGRGVYTIFEGEMSLNLLDYQDGALAIIGEADLEAGDYLQLRLVVDASKSNVVIGENTYALKIPSGSSCGIKIKGTGSNPLFTVEAGDDAELVFDFDAALSVSGSAELGFVLKPVIKEIKFENQVRFEYQNEGSMTAGFEFQYTYAAEATE